MNKLFNRNQRIINADLIRVTAMIMVIFLHTILNFTVRPDFFATKLWFLFEPITALSKSSVLLFLILSGYLVVSKKRSIEENSKKILKKIVIPLAFFEFLNILFIWTKFDKRIHSFGEFLIQETRRVIGFPSSPLWFLVVLLFLYALNPVWQLIFKDKKLAKKITFWSLVVSVLTPIFHFPINRVETMFNFFTAWVGYAFFYLYGALIRKKYLKTNNQKINLILVGLGLILTIAGDYLSSWQEINNISNIWINYTRNYLSIPVVMIAIGLFNFLLNLDLSKFKTKFLTQIAKLSFGIYLIHPYVISFFTEIIKFDFNWLHMNVYLYNFFNVSLVLGISSLITFIIKTILNLNTIIGE